MLKRLPNVTFFGEVMWIFFFLFFSYWYSRPFRLTHWLSPLFLSDNMVGRVLSNVGITYVRTFPKHNCFCSLIVTLFFMFLITVRRFFRFMQALSVTVFNFLMCAL